VNPDYDPNSTVDSAMEGDVKAQEILIEEGQRHRIISFDETHVCVGEDVHQTPEGIVTLHTTENGFIDKYIDTDVSSVQSASSMTCIGGSAANGDALPLFVVFPNNSFDLKWTLNGPQSNKIDPRTNEPYSSLFTANDKGGMSDKMGLDYLNTALIPFCPDISPMNKYILLCDGHGSHLTAAFIQRCATVGFELILRVPHTSDKTQGEDYVSFGVFKKQLALRKGELLLERSVHTEEM
jgi:hypothetical protein